ncbi:restriction endonuclease subunit S [Zhongshania guokunii]|uniref:Restriction endonuclease subunit S n=1 Tax=Zhongshania guokunii TaxID=641783 RepID=A0ABV3U3F4_9GAMM
MSNLGDILRQVVCMPSDIPDDWSFLKLTDVCTPKQWRTIASDEMTSSGYPVFGANGFVGFYHDYNHEEETVAITCRGNTCGTINRIPPKTYITGNSMALDNVRRSVITQDYLYYALTYRGVGDSVSGSAQPQITGAGLKNIEFPAPNLPEQQKIAAILSTVDDVIEKTRAQIDKLKDLKAGMMQELLTKGIGHTEFKDSPVGRIPVGWDIKILPEISRFQNGKAFPSSDYLASDSSGVYLVKPVNLDPDGKVNWSYRSTAKLSLDYWGTASAYRVGAGEILMNLTAQSLEDDFLGRVCMTDLNAMCMLNQRIARITANEDIISQRYLFWALRGRFFRQHVERITQGSKVQHLYNSNLELAQIAYPTSKSEQCKISFILDGIESTIAKNRYKLKANEKLKKALMQDLLTGKVRVRIDNKVEGRVAV